MQLKQCREIEFSFSVLLLVHRTSFCHLICPCWSTKKGLGDLACAAFSHITCMSTVVNQCSFVKVFNVMWHSSTTPKVIRGGFKRAGIFPYNPSSIFDYSKLAPTAIRQGTHTSASDATVSPPSTEATTTSPVSIPTVIAVPEPPALVLHLCTEPSTGGFVAHIPQSPDGHLFDTPQVLLKSPTCSKPLSAKRRKLARPKENSGIHVYYACDMFVEIGGDKSSGRCPACMLLFFCRNRFL